VGTTAIRGERRRKRLLLHGSGPPGKGMFSTNPLGSDFCLKKSLSTKPRLSLSCLGHRMTRRTQKKKQFEHIKESMNHVKTRKSLGLDTIAVKQRKGKELSHPVGLVWSQCGQGEKKTAHCGIPARNMGGTQTKAGGA